MPIRPRVSTRSLPGSILCLALLAALCACHHAPRALPGAPGSEAQGSPTPRNGSVLIPVLVLPETEKTGPEPLAEVASIQQQISRELDPALRARLFAKLAFIGTPEALAMLHGYYRSGPDDTRANILHALHFYEGKDLNPVLLFFDEALKATQPPILRLAAARALQAFADARALVEWRKLTDDANPEIRATARAMVHTYGR